MVIVERFPPSCSNYPSVTYIFFIRSVFKILRFLRGFIFKNCPPKIIMNGNKDSTSDTSGSKKIHGEALNTFKFTLFFPKFSLNIETFCASFQQIN